jgi:hypothetical protein
MAKLNSDSLRKTALESLAKQLGGKTPEIVSEDADIVPSSKASVFRFIARPDGEPNGLHSTAVFDDAGAPVDLAKLSLTEGKVFFPVPIPKVDLPGTALARRVTINPKVNDIKLSECGFREKITVTIPAQPISERVDVYFLADNTGSMGGSIASVQAGASSIMTTLAGMVPDIQFGVGNYRDFGDPTVFLNQQVITANQVAVSNAINGWSATGGGDTPEAPLFALQSIPGVAGFRPGVVKFIVWFGDAPSHEPICQPVWGGGFNITRATVISGLTVVTTPKQPLGIAVLGISVSSGPGLDDASSGGYAGCPSNGLAGQATDITTATGGSLSVGVNPANVATAILNALISAIQIQNVNLVPSGAIASFVSSITPAGGYGPLDPTKPHTLVFDVLFERDAEVCSLRDQVFTGSIDVVMDHAIVARKPTKITIPKCRYHYVVKYVCGIKEAEGKGCSPVRAGRFSTEINIFNGYCSEAVIEKRVIPVVLKGEAIGREPRFAKEMAKDKIVLPPNTATMDDCCRLAELLKQPVTSSGPLHIGFLEIVSTVPLSVTAVYTAASLKNESVSIDVEQIHEIRR